MKKMLFLSTLLLLSHIHNTQAQQHRWLDVIHNGDCVSAIEIDVKDTIHAINSPKGYGNILEFQKNNKNSKKFIEQEHHTVWYTFEVPADGELTFELTPDSPNDDYDFMLFKYEETDDFCQALINKEIIPSRTNISRNNPQIGSKTGLKIDSTLQDSIQAGPGDDYSRAIRTKANDRYYLLVDNVYKNGKGHQITFHHEAAPLTVAKPTKAPQIIKTPNNTARKGRKYTLRGIVLDTESNLPLKADVKLFDAKTGEVITQTESDSITGEYELEVDEPVDNGMMQPFTLEISKDGYFFDSEDMSPYQLHRLDGIKIKKRIPKLRKGKTFRINNINFYGNQARPLPSSYPTFKALLKVMQKNKTLKIRVEGHTNGCHQSWTYSKQLSDARAATVKNFLIDNGVDADRIQSEGFSCDKMLFPRPKDARENMLNRRVEIRVLEY